MTPFRVTKFRKGDGRRLTSIPPAEVDRESDASEESRKKGGEVHKGQVAGIEGAACLSEKIRYPATDSS
jgi:hypothetical protein